MDNYHKQTRKCCISISLQGDLHMFQSFYIHSNDESYLVFQASCCSLSTYPSIWLIRPIWYFFCISLIFRMYPALCYKIQRFLNGCMSFSSSMRLQCVAKPVPNIRMPASITVFVKPTLPPYHGNTLCRINTAPTPQITPMLTLRRIVLVILA